MKASLKNPVVWFFVFATLLVLGCNENPVSTDKSETAVRADIISSSAASAKIMRNAQLLDAAYGPSITSASKGGDGRIVVADLFAFVGFNTFEANGVTPRILDGFEVTNRILDEYGITRRVLEDYGITNRVLEDYGITRRVLDDYGLTRRVLDDYGITQRLLDDYGLSWDDFAAILADYDAALKVRASYDDGVSIWIRGEDVESILEEMFGDSDINFVEPDPEAEFLGVLGRGDFEDKSAEYVPWGIDQIYGGQPDLDLKDVHVYLLDSGVGDFDLKIKSQKDFTMLFQNRDQMAHEENDWMNPGFFDPGNDGNPDDENGHGTHVAGTMAALDNDKGVVGAAPGLQIHSLKVLTAEGRTDVTTLVAAINYVIHQKEEEHHEDELILMNISIGMDIDTENYNVLDETVAKAVAKGIVVVVSAGNSGKDAKDFSPAHVKEAITVGSYDNSGKFSKFSNKGSIIDILAPGEDVVSLPRTKDEFDENVRVLRSGTSMAAPHVTAAAAVLWSKNPWMSPEDVAQALVLNAGDEVKGTPRGTTNASVSMEFAATIRIDKAKWDSKDGEFKIEGTGPKFANLEVRAAGSGTHYMTITTDKDGDFKFKQKGFSWVPCDAEVVFAGNSAVLTVEDTEGECTF